MTMSVVGLHSNWPVITSHTSGKNNHDVLFNNVVSHTSGKNNHFVLFYNVNRYIVKMKSKIKKQ